MADEYNEKELEAEHKSQIEDWRRRKYKMEDAHEAAIKGMSGFLKTVHKNELTRKNLCVEFRDYMRGNKQGGRVGSGAGFRSNVNDTDTVFSPEGIETVTGFDAKPWENREDDDDFGGFRS